VSSLKTKVLHLITCLDSGGAEKILFDFATHSNHEKYEHSVVSLRDLGYYGPLLVEKGLKVYSLSMKKKAPFQLWELWKILSLEKPNIIHSWLYHANFLTIFTYIIGYRNIIWSIHNTLLPWKTASKLSIILNRISALFSFIPKKIVFCGKKAKEVHLSIGYKKKSSVVIYNGYDLIKFNPHCEKKPALLEQLSLKKDRIIIGSVGRFDPAKDHQNLLKALGIVKSNQIDFTLLLVGKDMEAENQKLQLWIKQNNLIENVRMLGKRNDVNELYQIMDFLTLSSEAEAFPNVVAEAMACGIPCVVTEAGDAPIIVGETGFIVPIKNAPSLSQAIITMINMPAVNRKKLGTLARERIEIHFQLEKMVDSYEKLYHKIAD